MPYDWEEQSTEVSQGKDTPQSLWGIAEIKYQIRMDNILDNFSGQHVWVLSHPHGKVLPDVRLVLALGTTEESLALLFLHPFFSYLCTMIRSPLSLLLSRLNGPGYLSLSWQEKCSLYIFSGPLPDSLQELHYSLVVGSPELDTALQVCSTSTLPPHQCWKEGSAPSTCWQPRTRTFLYHTNTLLAQAQSLALQEKNSI